MNIVLNFPLYLLKRWYNTLSNTIRKKNDSLFIITSSYIMPLLIYFLILVFFNITRNNWRSDGVVMGNLQDNEIAECFKMQEK